MSDLLNNYYKINDTSFDIPELSDDDIISEINNDFNNFETTLKKLLIGYPVRQFNLMRYHYKDDNGELLNTNIKVWRYQCKLPDYIKMSDSFITRLNKIASQYNSKCLIKKAEIGSSLWKTFRSSLFTTKSFVLIEFISNIPENYVKDWINKNGRVPYIKQGVTFNKRNINPNHIKQRKTQMLFAPSAVTTNSEMNNIDSTDNVDDIDNVDSVDNIDNVNNVDNVKSIEN